MGAKETEPVVNGLTAAGTLQALKGIIGKLTSDQSLQEDLLQESLVHLWRMRRDKPGQTTSYYLQACRFFVQHRLNEGRSVDAPKRSLGDNRIPIDTMMEELPKFGLHTDGETMHTIYARDIVMELSCRLEPRENKVLSGLADGQRLSDIANELNLSYPTILKCRRRIASVTVQLGIAKPHARSLDASYAPGSRGRRR